MDGQNTNTQQSTQALSGINRDLEEKAVQERAKELNLPYVDVGMFPVNPDILHVTTEEEARTALAMPFYKTGTAVKVAVSDPKSPAVAKLLAALSAKGFIPQVHLASARSITESFHHFASPQYKVPEKAENVVKEEEIQYEKALKNMAGLKDEVERLAAEEALNLLSLAAIKTGASDIHYQPHEHGALLRFRIDGVLHPAFELSRATYGRLADHLKYKAGMKLNITSVPQDGRFRFSVNDRNVDVRVASLPTEYGESFVLRILDSGKHFQGFEELGFQGHALAMLKKAVGITQGMILVSGPTSSGKTTTLYSLLQRFNKPELNIITLEDPIEYHLEGITQSQVDEKRGYNFSEGLKSVLRQDPDIVMLGEIRDRETAEVSVQAALTGHILLSTIHTKSAVDTIPRLLTLGVPAFMVSPSLSFVVAQRLVRRLCECAENGKPKGCEKCSETGYRGQMVITEVLEVDEAIENAILKNASSLEILALAKKNGMVTMEEDAMEKVKQGLTTPEEVHRVVNAA